MLAAVANLLAAALLAFTIFFYVVIYTMWLKRRTPQNIVIGGAAGALPPMSVAPRRPAGRRSTALCSLIIFFWTPPHFWALALVKSARLRARRRADDAGRQGSRPHPARNPGLFAAARAARRRAVVLRRRRAASMARPRSSLGVVARRFRRAGFSRARGADANKIAMRLFGFTILYLFILFGILVVGARLRSVRALGPMRNFVLDSLRDGISADRMQIANRRRAQFRHRPRGRASGGAVLRHHDRQGRARHVPAAAPEASMKTSPPDRQRVISGSL